VTRPSHWLALFALITIPFTTHAQTLHLEAKDAQLQGTSLKVMPAEPAAPGAPTNYSGKGYVIGFYQPADRLIFHATIKQPGLYSLALAYRSPYRRHYNITINADGIDGNLPPTSPTDFATLPLGKVELLAGDNTITFKPGGYDIDYIELKPTPQAALLPVTTPPVDPEITAEARALLRRLDASYGKTTAVGVYAEEDGAYAIATTGVRPAIMGGDLLWYSPYFISKQPVQGDEVQRLITASRSGQMITLSWHWPSPMGAMDTKEKPWWGAFYTSSTTFDVTRAVDPSTPEHAAALADIDTIAVQLRRFQDAHVPILWRPLFEAWGQWFWWGAKGPEPYKQLWAMLYDRLVHVDGIHNLLWVYTSEGDQTWYPGDSTVDIVGIDGYPEDIHDPESRLWDLLQTQFGGRKPLVINEFGGTPDIPRMQHFGEYWLYALCWSNKYSHAGPQKNTPAELNRIYKSPGVVTLPVIPAPPAPTPSPPTHP
jgi:mannan endo-1,4-beta-mannosidase